MRQLLQIVRAPILLVSFNNEGYLSREQMESLLSELFGGRGKVTTIEQPYKRYVGAQIGIYNPQGQKVGNVTHLRNKEFIYAVSRESLAERLACLQPRTAAQLTFFD